MQSAPKGYWGPTAPRIVVAIARAESPSELISIMYRACTGKELNPVGKGTAPQSKEPPRTWQPRQYLIIATVVLVAIAAVALAVFV